MIAPCMNVEKMLHWKFQTSLERPANFYFWPDRAGGDLQIWICPNLVVASNPTKTLNFDHKCWGKSLHPDVNAIVQLVSRWSKIHFSLLGSIECRLICLPRGRQMSWEWQCKNICHPPVSRSIRLNLRAPLLTCYLPADFLKASVNNVHCLYYQNNDRLRSAPESPAFCLKSFIKLILHAIRNRSRSEGRSGVFTSYLSIGQRARHSEWHLSNVEEMQPKHRVKSTAPRSSQQCFLMVPRGKAVERACHIKYNWETRSFSSNIKNAGKWKQNVAK